MYASKLGCGKVKALGLDNGWIPSVYVYFLIDWVCVMHGFLSIPAVPFVLMP